MTDSSWAGNALLRPGKPFHKTTDGYPSEERVCDIECTGRGGLYEGCRVGTHILIDYAPQGAHIISSDRSSYSDGDLL